MTKSVCLHAAFLRSPRENPWTGGVEPEDCAYPYPDEASRLHAESVGPFAFDPLRDAQGRVRGAADVFASLSFSFSPRWLSWLERERPETYRRVLEADRDSAARLGRGNALAQPYGDSPLTELGPRERRTAVRWGKEDFQRRFGRAPEGLWLPGGEADEETLALLIAEGFSLTVLPPGRAARVRLAGGGEGDWKEVRPETFNPTRPYRWRCPQGGELAVFFPHPLLGEALASGTALRGAEALRLAVQARFLPDDSTQLVHAVLSGEGEGHPFEDGASKRAANPSVKGAPAVLGEALRALEADGVAAVNYAAFLDRFPPPQEVELAAPARRERPSWRAALAAFSESLDAFYAERLGAWLEDPWEARDAYAELLADPSPRQADAFLARRTRRHLRPQESRQALQLLELQRRRLLTACEPGPDPLRALKQAGRARELAADLGCQAAPELQGTGAEELWAREVVPAGVDERRACAHFAILEHLGVCAGPSSELPAGERFSLLACSGPRAAAPLPGGRDASWSWLRLTVRDAEVRRKGSWSVCVHQLERLDLASWVLPPQEVPAGLAETFAAAPGEEFRAELCRRFGESFLTLDALLGQERLQVVRWLMPDPSGSRPRRKFLRDWAAAVGALRRGGGDAPLLELLPRCREAGILPDQLPWAGEARAAAERAMADFLASGARPELDRALDWLAAAERAGLHLDLFSLRSRLLVWLDSRSGSAGAAERELSRALAERLGFSPFLSSSTEACPS